MAATETAARPKKPISAAQLEANRRNAGCSTGPKSPEGKARSKFNRVIHGCYSDEAILPGEDAEALEHRLFTWADELGAVTEAERYAAARAVHASWKLDRCQRAEVQILTRQIHEAEEGYDDRLAAEVERLAQQLPTDPAGSVRQL